MRGLMKVYKIASEWIVAKNIRDAVRCHVSECGTDIRECLDEAKLIPDYKLDGLIYADTEEDWYKHEDGEPGNYRTFREQIEIHTKNKTRTPYILACEDCF